MTEHDLKVLDTIDSPEYISGELSDDELDIPAHMIPPNPDDSDILPSQVHPSYPYGNPTNIKHPASRPRPPYDPTSRALFEDGLWRRGVNGSLRWRDLALDRLLPVNEEKEEMKRAAEARKMANGATSQPQQQQQQPPPQAGAGDQTIDEEDEEEEDSAEHDENDVDEDNVEDEDDDMNEMVREDTDDVTNTRLQRV
ncbi:hypothetical protein F4604DRAFT_1885208 [Suillus subluteus]|nr:hypothetical protein F4604DRAFT_1885208 [Suillus subluteus]